MSTPEEDKWREAFNREHDEAALVIGPKLLSFLVEIGREGQRSAVVLGAERVNEALAELLKSFLRPASDKDNKQLFRNEGSALSSFSKKTVMAHRLGLVDTDMKHALNLVRDLRNDFAHATIVETLDKQEHANRVRELRKLVEGARKKELEEFERVFTEWAEAGEIGSTYLSCIIIMLIALEFTRSHIKRPNILSPAKLNFDKDDE